MGMGGTDAKQLLQLVQHGRVAPDDNFNPPVIQISRVALKSKPTAVAGDEPAKPYPLHFTGNQKSGGHHSGLGRRRRCQIT